MNRLWDKLPEQLKLNPYFQFSEETHFIPAWDRLRPEHFAEAADFVFDNFRADVRAIADNPAKPTFKNTAEALEQAWGYISYFYLAMFTTMPQSDEDEKQYDAIYKTTADKFFDIYYEIFTDPKLSARFINAWNSMQNKKFSYEQIHMISMWLNTFTACGINKTPEQREAMQKVSRKISDLATKSQFNMREAEKAAFLFVEDAEILAGLPDLHVRKAAAEAQKRGYKSGYYFGISNEVYLPFMQAVKDRSLRENIWRLRAVAGTHGPYDNRDTIIELIRQEHIHARLGGYKNSAAEILQHNMARTVQTVEKFLTDLRRAVKPVARSELAVIKRFALEQDNITAIQPWDLDYYEQRIRDRALGFTDEDIAPYLEFETVLKGVFGHFEKFFGLTFEETDAYPKYHPDVRSYNVTNRAGRHMGVINLDLFARDGKSPGTAWDVSAVSQGMFEGKRRRAVDVVVMKIIKGMDGEPTFMTHYNLLVLLHELGHATHNMLSECKYQTFSGTATDTDFVEFPSQFQELFSFAPEFLDNVAVHYQTGERMPDEMKAKIAKSRKFMAGIATLKYAQKGWLDLSWYSKDPSLISDVKSFEDSSLRQFRLLKGETPFLTPLFNHTFGGGYESAFYSYQWSESMSNQLFAKFQAKGLYDRTLRAQYRKVLSKGAGAEEIDAFHSLAGKMNTKHLLKARGLVGRQFNYAAAFEPDNDNALIAPGKTQRVPKGP